METVFLEVKLDFGGGEEVIVSNVPHDLLYKLVDGLAKSQAQRAGREADLSDDELRWEVPSDCQHEMRVFHLYHLAGFSVR